MSPSRNEEIKRLREAVRLVEKSGQKNTIFHQQLAALEKPQQQTEIIPDEPEEAPKEAKTADRKGGKE